MKIKRSEANDVAESLSAIEDDLEALQQNRDGLAMFAEGEGDEPSEEALHILIGRLESVRALADDAAGLLIRCRARQPEAPATTGS